jgi:hypothetical protein
MDGVDPTGKDDAEFETSRGLRDKGAVITNVEGYLGKSVKGETLENQDIKFTFQKAAVVVYPYRALDGKLIRGAYVKIQVDVDSKKYDEIRFLQIVREIKYDGKNIETPVPADPLYETRRLRSGYDAKGKPIDGAQSLGWRIDQGEKDKNPYFGYSNAGDPEDDVEIGGTRSTLWDVPGYFDYQRNVGKEFITFAVGIKKGEAPVYLGGVRWGFYTYAAAKATTVLVPESPEFVEYAPEQLAHALNRWNSINGNQKLTDLILYYA